MEENVSLKGYRESVEWKGLRILYARYLLKKYDGLAAETSNELAHRVASYVATAEYNYGRRREAEKLFYELISSLRFLPNSPRNKLGMACKNAGSLPEMGRQRCEQDNKHAKQG